MKLGFIRAWRWISIACFLFPRYAVAGEAGKEPVAILELGITPGRSLNDHLSSAGPSVAVEVTPIEKWLELEAGVTPSFSRRSTEWAIDLLFKKPWSLSANVEFMAGIGPEWVHMRESGLTSNSLAGETVMDFMFWPGRKRKFGWYVEPGYEYNFGRGHERSIAISIGLLIAIHKR